MRTIKDHTSDNDQASAAEYRDALREWHNKRAERVQAERMDCPHTDHEHGTCLQCGADITDDLICRAEGAADAREDR